MATIRRFEDLECWKKARELDKEVYAVSSVGKFARDFEIKNQINAASGSVMDNIAEGFDRGGRNEFLNFLSYAKGSTGEVKSQLYRALDRGYIEQQTFERIYEVADSAANLIGKMMQYLNKSNYGGQKFKDRTEPQTPNSKP